MCGCILNMTQMKELLSLSSLLLFTIIGGQCTRSYIDYVDNLIAIINFASALYSLRSLL